jgi:hypothetical protein
VTSDFPLSAEIGSASKRASDANMLIARATAGV